MPTMVTHHQVVNHPKRGLIMHDGCELFLDDCMIHASTLDEYLKRLRQVFLRFHESKITLNLSKCKHKLGNNNK